VRNSRCTVVTVLVFANCRIQNAFCCGVAILQHGSPLAVAQNTFTRQLQTSFESFPNNCCISRDCRLTDYFIINMWKCYLLFELPCVMSGGLQVLPQTPRSFGQFKRMYFSLQNILWWKNHPKWFENVIYKIKFVLMGSEYHSLRHTRIVTHICWINLFDDTSSPIGEWENDYERWNGKDLNGTLRDLF
jgi:hypothetical protein